MLYSAAKGSPVNAIFDGIVIFSDFLRGYGLLAIIDHGDGYLNLYGHHDQLHISVGDFVKAGQTIGVAGTTGGLKSAGLYFEIRLDSRPTDPRPWLGSL